MAAFRKLSTKRNGGGRGGEGGGLRRAGGRSWAIRERCQQGPEDKGLIWAHTLSLWKLLGLGGGAGGKCRGEERKRKGEGGGQELPAWEPSFFLDWKQTWRVLGAWPVLPQRPSQWFPLEGPRDMVGGAERGRSFVKMVQPTGGAC